MFCRRRRQRLGVTAVRSHFYRWGARRHTERVLGSPCLQGEPRALPRRAQNLPKCVPRLSPLLAGCPHPSRCSAKAQHRATFPKGKARAAAAPCTEFAKVHAEVKPAVSGLPSSVTVQCQGTAPRHLPQGEGKSSSRRCRPQVRERIAEA